MNLFLYLLLLMRKDDCRLGLPVHRIIISVFVGIPLLDLLPNLVDGLEEVFFEALGFENKDLLVEMPRAVAEGSVRFGMLDRW